MKRTFSPRQDYTRINRRFIYRLPRSTLVEKNGRFSLIIAGKEVVKLNAIGIDILRLCNGINSLKDIEDMLIKSYNMDRKTIRKETLDFLTKFEYLELGLFVYEPAEFPLKF